MIVVMSNISFSQYLKHKILSVNILLIILFYLLSYDSKALQLGDNKIIVDELVPLFNVHIKSKFVSSSESKILNPEPIKIPSSARIATDIDKLTINAFSSDKVFKDISLITSNSSVKVSIKFMSTEGITITPRIVTSWYQAGITTKTHKLGGAHTYELLLTDDTLNNFDDKWVKSRQGGWVYKAPDIILGDHIFTELSNLNKRILLRFNIDSETKPGKYSAKMLIETHDADSTHTDAFPIEINIHSSKLIEEDDIRQERILFTAFLLDGKKQRQGSYVNSMRLSGTDEEKETLLSLYYADVKEHGFNGVTIRDWDPLYLDKNLEILSSVGIETAILHATTPVSRRYQSKRFPIVNDAVKEKYQSRNMDLLFYGYDEAGGNRKLKEQLLLNTNINMLGGGSVNAIFWSDMPRLTKETGNDRSKCIDIIAHSMGSHGHIEMFRSLPFQRSMDYCPGNDTKYLVYWHPHVENPIINRLFMGFWLWASGFDGVIPHGYYFPSHIEKVLTNKDRQRGVSNAASPYNDWSYWLPGQVLRHHNSVYPSSSGPVGTLQWEGVLAGYTDLKYVLSLEEILENNNIDESTRTKIRALLDEIRHEVLQIESPYLSDDESLEYLLTLERWKKSIAELLY